MLVVDLHCARGHHFEGWFASSDDLASQQQRGLVSCPVCGEHEVTRRPSAPHLNVSGAKTPHTRDTSQQAPSSDTVKQTDQPSAPSTLHALQALYLQTVRHVVANTEDVGPRFADEARSMHHGDTPARPIRGQASPDEREALRDEGIEVMSLPIPDGLKGPLQ